MAHQTKMTRDQILRELRTKSPRTYRKRLALAHHLKVTGNNPNLSNRFGPLEQEAGEMLAKTKFPLSPELKSQMEAGGLQPGGDGERTGGAGDKRARVAGGSGGGESGVRPTARKFPKIDPTDPINHEFTSRSLS